jgi:hypothetical protein
LAAPAGNGNGFTINGSMFDPSIINDIIQLGATEVWDIENTANMAHPFHIHGNSFQVVSRTNGVRPTHDYELGWKDVVVVYSQETVRIIKSFEDYADPESPYMSHCHILEHEDVGMMTHWVVADTIGGEVTALQFDGVDDRVTIPYDPSMPIESFTVSAWIKLQQPAGRAVIIARGEDDNSFNLSWQLYVKPNGTLEVMLEDSNEQNYCYPLNNCAPMGTCTVTGDLFVADDTWHHVAVTRDTSGILALYIDGENRAGCEETGVPSSNNFQDLSIGCTYGFIGPPPNGIEPPIWFFPGIIDEPAVWNRALNQDEISALFASGIELESDGLVGFWPFDEGNGQIVFDHSDLGNHGFLGEVSSEDSADPLWIYTQLSNEVEILPVFENVVLHPNFPNPFNPVTKIQFSLKDETVITLTLFDMLGRNVMELAKGMYPSGTHSFMIQMNQFPNGVYFYRITTPEKQITNKMLLLK